MSSVWDLPRPGVAPVSSHGRGVSTRGLNLGIVSAGPTFKVRYQVIEVFKFCYGGRVGQLRRLSKGPHTTR